MSSSTQQFSHLSADTLDQAMKKIEHCLGQLNEPQLWWRPEPGMNSIGNLLLHLAGNLQQWGVVPLTMVKDKRVRADEFASDTRIPTAELWLRLKSTVDQAKAQWLHLGDDQLGRQVTIQGFDVTIMHAIVHTTHHFVGHTHQIVQLTRLQLRGNYQFHWTPDEERGSVPV